MSTWCLRSAALGTGIFLAGCQLKPTQVRENPERRYDASAVIAPVKVSPDTVVIDARPSFDYSVAHAPRSINMQWSDFTDPERESRGVLQPDLFAIARRLASAGISPSSHVVVMGRGLTGDGEEGRIAWMLAYLGVTNVQFASMDSLKPRVTNIVEQNPPKSAPIWKPDPLDSLLVPREELIHVINNFGIEKPVAYKSGMTPVLYRIIDTRAASDYLGREGFGVKQTVPNMGAINIPWREFFDASLRPRTEMLKRLSEVGVLPQHRVIVINEDGVASADVTMALRALGYSKAGNCAGGLRDLLSVYSRRSAN